MKYYPPVLVVLRFLAVGLAVVALYYAVLSMVAFPAGIGMGDGSLSKLMERGRAVTLNHSFTLLGMGAGLYVISPHLARLITWGADARQRLPQQD